MDVTADQAIAAAAPTKDRDQQSGAVVFLMDILANGPVPVKTIEERAAARGFSKDQLKRAKQKMCVEAFKRREKPMAAGFGPWQEHAPREGPKTS